MGFGKILGCAALGLGAVAAAPFTGGGSLVGAATLATSLAGAGAMAAGAATVGAGVGVALSKKEEAEERAREEKISSLHKKAEKYEEAFKRAISEFQGDKEYFNYLIACTAIGISVANVDGEIVDEEMKEIDDFVGGIASAKYPKHVLDSIHQLRNNPPNFNEAMKYLEKVNPSNYESIQDLVEIVIEADEIVAEQEQAFFDAFSGSIKMIQYTPEKDDNANVFVEQVKVRFKAS